MPASPAPPATEEQMSQDLSTKKTNFLTRLTAANQTLLDTMEKIAALKAEWDANAYATGASPSGNNITDAEVQSGFPYMTAAQLNSLIGAHVSVADAVASNRGYLEAARG